eukprot:9636245-Ditylum_brightwellii.AAC.1
MKGVMDKKDAVKKKELKKFKLHQEWNTLIPCKEESSKGNVFYERVTERGDSYKEYVRKLNVAGRLGLEYCTPIGNIKEYLVGYFCKGAMSSMEWDTMLQSVL